MDPRLPATVVTGTDIYHEDGVQLHDLQNQGYRFCIVKATQGTTEVDPMFADRWQAMDPDLDPANGLTMLRGVYHYLASADPSEVQHFLYTVPSRHNMLRMALDIEVAFEGLYDAVEAAVKAIKAATGFYPFVYMNVSFWNTYFVGTWVASACPLWLAEYGVEAPQITSAVIWQWSEDGLDKDVFYGDEAGLKASHWIP